MRHRPPSDTPSCDSASLDTGAPGRWSRLRQWSRDDRGLVEGIESLFAALFLILLFLFFAQVVVWWHARNILEQAAAEGARIAASMDGSCEDAAGASGELARVDHQNSALVRGVEPAFPRSDQRVERACGDAGAGGEFDRGAGRGCGADHGVSGRRVRVADGVECERLAGPRGSDEHTDRPRCCAQDAHGVGLIVTDRRPIARSRLRRSPGRPRRGCRWW